VATINTAMMLKVRIVERDWTVGRIDNMNGLPEEEILKSLMQRLPCGPDLFIFFAYHHLSLSHSLTFPLPDALALGLDSGIPNAILIGY
jgi:hypothetical protein